MSGDPPSRHLCAGYGAASWNGTLSAFGWTRTAGLDALTVDGQNATVFEQGEWTAKGLAVPAGESTLTVTRTDVDQTVQQAQTTVSRPAGQTAYSHDLNGNMLGQGKWAFSWNDENRLVEAVAEGESRLTFVYDGQGRRRTKSEYSWNNGQWVLLRQTRYIWDGWLCLQHRIDEDGETVTETYLRGLDLSGSLEGAGGIGGMLAVTRCPDPVLQVPCALLVFFDNGRGDITELADPVTGAVVAHYECSPFGRLLVSSGPLADANPYRFSSKEHDATGLAYYGMRYYSPELGRWINRDPADISGGINQLAFCSNRPSDAVDSLGLWKRVGGSTSTIYEAESDWDRLEFLAAEAVGEWRDWVCIWPLPDASKWANYPIAKKCARADVSNLVATEGGAVTMMPRTSGDPWLPDVDSVIGPADYYWSTGIGAAGRLKSESGEGKTPLQDVLLVGHSGSAYRDLHRDGGTMPFDASHVMAVATENDNGINDYPHAVNRIGPPKCWFTRNAIVRGLGCQTGGTWAPYWAGTLMRSGSTTFGTRNYVLAQNPLFFFATYLRMSNSTSRSGAYGSKVYGRSELHLLDWKSFPGTQ